MRPLAVTVEKAEKPRRGRPAADRHEPVLGRADDARHPALGTASAEALEVEHAGAAPYPVDPLSELHHTHRSGGGEGRPQEDHVGVVQVGTSTEPDRSALDDGAELAIRAHHHHHERHTEPVLEHRLDIVLERTTWRVGREEHVAALDVRRHRLVAAPFEGVAKVGHRQLVLPTHVDAAEQADVPHHARADSGTGGSRVAFGLRGFAIARSPLSLNSYLGCQDSHDHTRARSHRAYVGVKEAVGGYFILEADDLELAVEVAARIPAARLGGAVEIRPVATYW